ncbi:transposase domain-containing protein [Oceanobacillus sp. CF4.6]
MVGTAKENGLNPFNYLKYLFEKLPNMDTSDKTKLDQLYHGHRQFQKNVVFQINLNKVYK